MQKHYLLRSHTFSFWCVLLNYSGIQGERRVMQFGFRYEF